MKRIIQITSALLFTFSFGLTTVQAQAPEKMSYQAVIRNVSNALVANQTVGMQISILQTTATGTAVYVETQTSTTNANGLVSLEIGTGTGVSGDFTSIDWGNGTYFIKTETDPTGGTAYSIAGTSQLMSVPYALHAKTAESITGVTLDGSETKVTAGTNVTVTGTGTTASPYVVNAAGGTNSSSGHYIGELFGGGIVYYVYENGAHGLIASLDDLDGGSGVAWTGQTTASVGVLLKNMTDGASNTAAMVAQDATANKAGTLCDSYSGGGFTDWYLPASRELYLLAAQDIIIDQILDNDGDLTTNGFSQETVGTMDGIYCSSTENFSHGVWAYAFASSSFTYGGKNGPFRVRAIRAF